MNRTFLILCIFILLIIPLNLVSGQNEKPGSSINIVKSIADRVINDTVFEFELFPQEEALDMQVIDFGQIFGKNASGIAYALSFVQCDKDTTIDIGICSSTPIKIWRNDQVVFQQSDRRKFIFKEIAYGLFVFQDTFKLELLSGANKILVKNESGKDEWRFLLRPLTPADQEVNSVTFSVAPFAPEINSSKWLCMGVFPITANKARLSSVDIIFPPEEKIENYYRYQNNIYTWTAPKLNYVLQLKISPDQVYKRDSYLEWHYANGTTMMGILALANHTSETKYLDFVKQFCDFTIDHYDYFRWQYEKLLAMRGTNHRLFRLTMLDDSSAPALIVAEYYLQDPREKYLKIINLITDYIQNKQVRLDDGTFCRPEPEPQTIWADDLFMSVPFLLRIAKITGDKLYFDDIARQVIQFAEKLVDYKQNLFYHGWNNTTRQHSVGKWGRANGWMMWAISEALLHLPKEHKDYQKILNIYQNHIAGLINYQNQNGMWHQVLDHPESYEETSCTAMFVVGLARGIRNGWIDKKYREHTLKAWKSLTTKIENGIVFGICRGTGIGNNLDFYFNRGTFPNDPRGLGAVMVAGIEVSGL